MFELVPGLIDVVPGGEGPVEVLQVAVVAPGSDMVTLERHLFEMRDIIILDIFYKSEFPSVSPSVTFFLTLSL